MTPFQLKIVGISLSILSLGLAIAYSGFMYFSTRTSDTSSASPSAFIR